MKTFLRWLRVVAAWLSTLLGKRGAAPVLVPGEQEPKPEGLLLAVLVDEQPDTLLPGEVYLVGEGKHRWFAAFVCPCGCGATVVLNLLPDMRPRWYAETHPDDTVSLRPSVHRKVGCNSHFVVRRGRVRWCEG